MFWNSISRGIESREIPERESRGVAHLAIAITDALKNFVRAAYVFHVIGRDAPETQDFRAEFGNDFIGRNGVAQGFVHCLALRVQRPPVAKDSVVRRAIMHRESNH